MNSKTDICNLALTKIGTNTVASLEDNSENSRRLNIIYEPLKREVLRDHTWTFATKIEPLGVIANEEIIGYEYLYTYPAECLYISKIFDASNNIDNDYKKMLSPDTNIVCIASNTYQAYVEYVKDIDNVPLFDDIFAQAFAARLASELVIPLIGDEGMANRFAQEYQLQIAKAKKSDKQERHAIRNISSPYVEAR